MSNIKKDFPKFSPYQQKAANPDLNVWVQANAGTGKTEILAGRLLRIFFRHMKSNPSNMPGILCLTYTEAGVGEMKTRIMELIRKWAMATDEDLREILVDFVENGMTVNDDDIKSARKVFFYCLDNQERLKICTIHSFCKDILTRFSLEAGLTPSWSIIQDSAQKVLFEKAFEKMATNTNMNTHTKEAFENILTFKTVSSLENLQKLLATKYKTMFAVDSKEKYRKYFEEKLRAFFKIDKFVSDEFDKNKLQFIIDETKKVAQNQPDESRAAVYFNIASHIEQFINKQIDFDEYKSLFLTNYLQPKTMLTNKRVKYIEENPDLYDEEIERIIKLATYRNNLKLYKDTMSLFDLAVEFEKTYKQIKTEYNVLDFDDLILYTTKLFLTPDMMGWISSQLDVAIDYILVDEAQDTSHAQWDIFNVLTEILIEGDSKTRRSSLVVGDSKQAIFGFQGADREAFNHSRKKLQEKLLQNDDSLEEVPLTQSFRSLSPILNVVDYFFDNNQIQQETGFINTNHKSFRSIAKNEKGGIVEMHDLFVNATGAKGEKFKQEYAKYLAKEIEEVAKRRKPEDIMILVKDRSEVLTYLIKELKGMEIPVAGKDKTTLNEFVPVRDLLNLVRFCRDTNDDYSLACVLKSPFYRLKEEQIYDLCKEKNENYDKDKQTPLWDVVQKSYADIAEELKVIIKESMKRAPYSFFTYLLHEKDCRKKMIESLGQHIIDPLEEFLTICLAYERTQTGTVFDFIKWFITGNIAVKRNMDTAKGVKIMTVHGSKGLSAPVVFLIDTMNVLKSDSLLDANHLALHDNKDYDLWIWKTTDDLNTPLETVELIKDYITKKDLEEYYRLLYVAMTRPKDELYIYGIGSSRSKSREDKPVKKTKKDEDAKQWHKKLWPIMQEIAEKAKITITKDRGNNETIRITDDDEIEEFFRNHFNRETVDR